MPHRKLEIYNKYLCGLVNIFFGIHMIGEGVKGVKKGGSHVGGGKSVIFICLMQ